MTKKHLAAIAEAIKNRYTLEDAQCADVETLATIRAVAEDLAKVFVADNPRFDKARFLKACGFED